MATVQGEAALTGFEWAKSSIAWQFNRACFINALSFCSCLASAHACEQLYIIFPCLDHGIAAIKHTFIELRSYENRAQQKHATDHFIVLAQIYIRALRIDMLHSSNRKHKKIHPFPSYWFYQSKSDAITLITKIWAKKKRIKASIYGGKAEGYERSRGTFVQRGWSECL